MQKPIDILVIGCSMELQQMLADGLHSDTNNVRVSPADNFTEGVGNLALSCILGKDFDAYVLRSLIRYHG